MEDPSIIMTLLNSQIVDIKANSRISTFITADGIAFVMGRDFRPKMEEQSNSYSSINQDLVYGIPKRIEI